MQPDTTPGDVVVVLQQQEHATFRRDGANLFHKHSLTLLEALTGFSFPLPHLDGRTLLIKSEANSIVRPGDIKALRDEGMPMAKNPYVRGAIYVEFDVVFPSEKQLTDSAKKVLKQVLPQPSAEALAIAAAAQAAAGDAAMTDANGASGVEEATLVTVDFEREKLKFEQQSREDRAEEEEDEDDPRAHAGHGQPQCRQQ